LGNIHPGLVHALKPSWPPTANSQRISDACAGLILSSEDEAAVIEVEVVRIEDEVAVVEDEVAVVEDGGVTIEDEVDEAASLDMIEDKVDKMASLDVTEDEADKESSPELARARYTTRMMPTQGTLQRCMVNM